MKKLYIILLISLSLHASSPHKTAGVNAENRERLITAIHPIIKETTRAGVDHELENFMGLFDLKRLAYQDPILISSTDGVGDKLILAQEMKKHSTIGIDLVAMNINDLLARGAEPLLFLDYYAMGSLDINQSTQLITGMAAACKKGNCALIGGQTAELPSIYKNGNYDIAGFAVGVVERHQILPKIDSINNGDLVIGIASSGLHAHGFPTIQHIVQSKNINLEGPAPFTTTSSSFGAALLTPSAIYTHAVLPLCKADKIKAIVHIAEGGLLAISHIIPQYSCVKLYFDQWYIPPIFRWIKHMSNYENREMARLFNLGIGMVLIVSPEEKDAIIAHIHHAGYTASVIGKVHQVDGFPVQLHGFIKSPLARIMIIGNSAREHALAWKLAQSSFVEAVYIVNGNGGTYQEKKITNMPMNLNHAGGLITYAQKNYVDLVIVSGQGSITQTIIDECHKNGLRCLGPTKKTATLEASHSQMKDFFKKYNIATSNYQVCTTYDDAAAVIDHKKIPITLKTDGISEKGSLLADTHDHAKQIAHDMLVKLSYGNAGKKIIIQDGISGQEISAILITDGQDYKLLTTTQNHPHKDNGDKGAHTIGMGSCCPAPIVTPALNERITKEIINPLIDGLIKEGHNYKGFLHIKIIIDRMGNPYIIDFSSNSGDPETPTMIMRLQSDLYTLCNAIIEKKLDELSIIWDERHAVSVVITSEGYPDSVTKGDTIVGIPDKEDGISKLFHGNTRSENNTLITDGSRVLCAVALGKTLESARNNAYNVAQKIYWPDMHFRRDIGYKAIASIRA